jgi:hypothetical protein
MKTVLFESTTTSQELFSAMKSVMITGTGRPRAALPILTHVLVRGTGYHALVLTCTDLDTAKCSALPSATRGAGAVAVPARLIRNIASKLRDIDAPVTLRGIEDASEGSKDSHRTFRLEIACGDCRFNLNAMSADEFPVVDRFFEECTHPRVVVAGMVRRDNRLNGAPLVGACSACGASVDEKHIHQLRPDRDSRHGIYWQGEPADGTTRPRAAAKPPANTRRAAAPKTHLSAAVVAAPKGGCPRVSF